jgi:osmotically-inducible protein OsmY
MRVQPTTIVSSALALGAGAALMYLLDPQGGRRRRAQLKDKARHTAHEAGDKASAVAKDVGNRARGLAAEATGRFRNEELTDEQLAQRVRSSLGHFTDHAGAIEVMVHDGRVTLAGPAVADEVDELVKAASKVRGVHAVENRLQMHETPAQIPALQH